MTYDFKKTYIEIKKNIIMDYELPIIYIYDEDEEDMRGCNVVTCRVAAHVLICSLVINTVFHKMDFLNIPNCILNYSL